MHSVFRNLCMPCAMELFSSALDSSALSSSAMDSSAIGVGVAVLVGKCMQGPCMQRGARYSEYQIVLPNS